MKFLELIRKKKGLTLYAMAQLFEISPPTYTYYERHSKGMNIETLCRIRAKIGLSWEQFGRLLDRTVEIEGVKNEPKPKKSSKKMIGSDIN